MSYFENLTPGEEVLLRARKSTIILADTIILSLLAAGYVICFYTLGWFGNQSALLRGVLAFAPLVVAILLLINDIAGFMDMELVVTNMRVLGKTGIVALTVMDVPLKQITDMRVDVSMLGRLLDYGNLTVYTASGEFVYDKINNPLNIQSTINGAKL